MPRDPRGVPISGECCFRLFKDVTKHKSDCGNTAVLWIADPSCKYRVLDAHTDLYSASHVNIHRAGVPTLTTFEVL